MNCGFALPTSRRYTDCFTSHPYAVCGLVGRGVACARAAGKGTNKMAELLMPKATAVWLVDNTTLSFDQIAAFCGLHPLEVQGIADGEVAIGIRGLDPVVNGQVTREELQRCEQDSSLRLEGIGPATEVPPACPARPLHAGQQAAGSTQRHRLVAQELRRAERRADRQAARHHQGDDQRGARAIALEHAQHYAPGPHSAGHLQRGRAPRCSPHWRASRPSGRRPGKRRPPRLPQPRPPRLLQPQPQQPP